MQEVKRREDAQQAAQAAKREEADRIYSRLKAEKEAAMAADEEQHFLINLLQQEEAAERDRQAQADRAAYRVCPAPRPLLVPRHTAAAYRSAQHLNVLSFCVKHAGGAWAQCERDAVRGQALIVESVCRPASSRR